MMRQEIVRHNQSWVDIAVQYYGSVEGLEYLLEDNSQLTLDNMHVSPIAGAKINIRNKVIREEIVQLFKNNNQNVATSSLVIYPTEGVPYGFLTEDGIYLITENNEFLTYDT